MILTYRYRIKDRSAKKTLRRHAYAVNQVWNWCVAQQRDVRARWLAGAKPRKWASQFDLAAQLKGVGAELGVHQQTVQCVTKKFCDARQPTVIPRFRSSDLASPRRSLGWVPFQGQSRSLDRNSVTYLGKRYRFWEGGRPVPENAKGGCFVEDARGRWYVCFQVEVPEEAAQGASEIGIDLGLKSLAVTSDGEVIENPRHFRKYEQALGVAQRAGNKRRVTAIHAKIANARKDFLHKLTTRLVRESRLIVVGDVNSGQLKRTRMAKSVSDAGWYEFKTQLSYKASRHGVAFIEADERLTSQTCSACGSVPASSPKGVGALGIRRWDCSDCGAVHDRDINAARNILRVGRSVPPRADESRRIAA